MGSVGVDQPLISPAPRICAPPLRFLWKAIKNETCALQCKAPQVIKALKCPGSTFAEKPGLGAPGLWEQDPPELLCWELWGRGKPTCCSHTQGWRSDELTWAGSCWERSGIGRFGAPAECSTHCPCSLLGVKLLSSSLPLPFSARAAPHPSSFYHTMSVWGPQERRVDVSKVVSFSRECFCYLPAPCETSHAAPTAAELLCFPASPSPGDGR